MTDSHLEKAYNDKFLDQRSDQRKEKKPVVYFGSIDDGTPKGTIKIGYTADDIKRRFSEHNQTKNGVKVSFSPLCAVRGSRSDETAIHRYFKKFLLDGEKEIFTSSADVVDYIRWLRDQYFVWVPDDHLCDDIANHEAVDSSIWIPSPERKKDGPKQSGLFEEFGNLNLPPRVLTVDDFYTNPAIIQAARECLGGVIELDPASHPIANREVRANRFFTFYDNGLQKEWSGKIWCNPPFSQWQEWVPKIISEWKSGRILSMCILCATRTLTAQYFSPIHSTSTGVCILFGRIPFWGGRATGTPDDGHAVFYYGDDFLAFRRSFSRLGTVYLTSKE